jgi:hypothetical protein
VETTAEMLSLLVPPATDTPTSALEANGATSLPAENAKTELLTEPLAPHQNLALGPLAAPTWATDSSATHTSPNNLAKTAVMTTIVLQDLHALFPLQPPLNQLV